MNENFLLRGKIRNNRRSRPAWFPNRNNDYDEQGASSSNADTFSGRGRGRGRGRRPPSHLRGKDIGLFYANRNRVKNHIIKVEKGKPIGAILLSKARRDEIKKLLQSVKDDSTTSMLNISSSYDMEDSEFKTKFLNIITGTIEEKLDDPLIRKCLTRNTNMDTKYYNELMEKIDKNDGYKKFLPIRQKLPSYSKKDEIIKLLDANQVIVISGETGCGKTTQVAQFILDDCILSQNGSLCKIVCTQPRRISAISVAERVADERGENCGFSSVGYQIRLERKLPRTTGSIIFCTTGVLLQQMQSDPFLSGISHVILDEIHERDVTSDFIITLLKQIITKRTDLKLILMSATLNAEKFCRYFNNCASLNIPGFTFPVECFYLEDVLSRVDFDFPTYHEAKNWRKYKREEKEKRYSTEMFLQYIEPYVRNIRRKNKYSRSVCNNLLNPNSEKLNLDLIYKLLKYICNTYKDDGAILIFLPGISDITKLNRKILECGYFASWKFLIILLHSKMPSVHQRAVFNKPPIGVRKIVIATNIAETSITIDDVIYVIDCGRIKMSHYDVNENLETLNSEWVSLANADQRKGRAGRVQAGVCFHLFTKPRRMILEMYQIPEVQRSRLENIILTIKILQLGCAETFLNKLMDPPVPLAITNALTLLKHMKALDASENLTPLGYHLARLPVNPRMGKMILLGALFSCLDPILSIAASLDFKDAFYIPIDKSDQVDKMKRELLNGWNSDHLVLAAALRGYETAKETGADKNYCYKYFLSKFTLELLINMKDQFAEYLYSMDFLTNKDVKSEEWNQNSTNLSLIKAIVCASLYPNVAIIRKYGNKHFNKRIETVESERVCIHPNSVNEKENVFASPLLVYHRKIKSTKIYLHDTTMVHPLPLMFFGDKITIEEHSDIDATISLSNVLKFTCANETAFLIKKLRKQLNKLLQYKISHPGIIDWMHNSKEVDLLRAIMELITSEDMGDVNVDPLDDYQEPLPEYIDPLDDYQEQLPEYIDFAEDDD